MCGNSQGLDPSSVGKMVRILGIALLGDDVENGTESPPSETESPPIQGASVESGDCSPPGIVSTDVVDANGSVSPELLTVAPLVVSNADV